MYYALINSMQKTPASTLLTGLYAVYKAESNANDSLGVRNGTAVGGVTYTSGKSGNAFTFNGTTGLISLSNGDLSSLGSSFSYSFWVNQSASGIMALVNTYTSTGGDRGFYTRISAGGGGIQTYAFNSSGTAIVNGAGFNTLALSTWHHIAVTFDGSNIRTYKNGALADTTAYSGTIAFGATTYPSLGCLYYAPATYAYFLNGSMDETYFYTKKLTDLEVTNLYNSSVGKFYPTF